MTTLSFNGANLVAQQVGWSMAQGWDHGDGAANDFYRPIDTFADRFGAFLRLAKTAGFSTVDVWTGQLNWTWATPDHFEILRRLLADEQMSVGSYAGAFGETAAQFRAACEVARALGTDILGGAAPLVRIDRAALISVLASTQCRLGIENHPGDTTPQDILDKIGTDGGDLIGTAVDTGWWGTHGFDAAEAIRALGHHVIYVHLKDVRAAGGHETCALGDGVVPIADCLKALDEIGYSGPISIEHEPDEGDPVPDVVVSAGRVRGWIADLASGRS